MNADGLPVLGFFAGTALLVMVSIEAGYRLGRMAHRRRVDEKESPISAIEARVEAVIDEAERIQERLWSLALVHAYRDLNSDVASLYVQSINDISTVHATRVAIGLQTRIPVGIWVTLGLLAFFGMSMVGYQAGVVESKRTLGMTVLALAFASVVALIASLDQPIGGFTLTSVSQQPMIDLLADIERHRLAHAGG